MFLDRSSFTRVHMLLQRLRNLLTLAQWARKQLSSAHLWHGTQFRTHTAYSWNLLICLEFTRIKMFMFIFRCGGPMCGVQGCFRLLQRQTWLLDQRAQGSKATHMAGTAGSVVGHHGTSAQVPWYRYDDTHYIILTGSAAMTHLNVFGSLLLLSEAHEVKRISQMWKEMDHSHRKAHLETPG